MERNRRTVLRTGAALVTVGGVAGVSTAATNERGRRGVDEGAASRAAQLPAYANWIPATGEVSDPRMVGMVYAGATPALLGSYDSEQSPTDPMVRNPSVLGGFSYFSWLGLAQLGIHEQVVGPTPEEGTRDPANVPTDQTAVVGGETQVYLGSYDADAIQSAVDDGKFSEAGDGVYAHDERKRFVTWTDGAVVVGTTQSFVEAVRAAGAGDVQRRVDDDDWAWLLRTGGTGGLAYAMLSESVAPDQMGQSEGGEGESPTDLSMFRGARGVAQSTWVDGGSYPRARTAVLYPSGDGVNADRLSSALGTAADDTAIRRDGPRVTMSATYDGSAAGTVAARASTATPAPTDAADGSPTAGSAGGDRNSGDGGGGGTGDGSGERSSGSGPGMGALAGLAGVAGAGSLLDRRGDE